MVTPFFRTSYEPLADYTIDDTEEALYDLLERKLATCPPSPTSYTTVTRYVDAITTSSSTSIATQAHAENAQNSITCEFTTTDAPLTAAQTKEIVEKALKCQTKTSTRYVTRTRLTGDANKADSCKGAVLAALAAVACIAANT